MNLTEDIILTGRPAADFSYAARHPDAKAIKKGSAFVSGGNFRTEERDGKRYLFDDNVDWDGLDKDVARAEMDGRGKSLTKQHPEQ